MLGLKKNFDFISIGDITTDAFIRLKDASINCDVDKENCKLCVRFGDKVPYDDVTVVPAVGNSPNAAVSAARLGLKSALVTNMGDDDFGVEDLETLKSNDVDTRFVKVHKGKKTNYHYVLSYEAERTILIKHHEYEYTMPDVGEPKWFYFSSIGETAVDFHDRVADYLDEHPDIKLAFQPGTFQINVGYERLKRIYQHSEVFFCNVQEAQKILGKEEDVKSLLKDMHALGPKIAVITDGPDGAYAMSDEGTWFMPAYPDPAPPFERTGAGDSFSSTFTVALALGKSIPEALSWGPINSMSVVQETGAQAGLLTRDKLEEYLQNAPDYYQPEKIQ